MITGWDRGFIIEKESNKYTKKFSCSLCENYDPSDKSCNIKCIFLPEVGYDMWKNCSSVSYLPNGQYSDEHIYQLIKAGKTRGIRHISMNDLGEDAFYDKSKSGFNYWDMKEDYLELFSKIYYEKSISSIEKACILVPEEFLDKYRKALSSLEFDEFYEVVGAFVHIVGCRAGGKIIRSITKYFHACYMEKMFSQSIEEISLYSISKEFVSSFALWMGKKNYYSKIKELKANNEQ